MGVDFTLSAFNHVIDQLILEIDDKRVADVAKGILYEVFFGIKKIGSSLALKFDNLHVKSWGHYRDILFHSQMVGELGKTTAYLSSE